MDEQRARIRRRRPDDATLMKWVDEDFFYVPETGKLHLRKDRWPRKSGELVGGQGAGRYSTVYLKGHRFKAHRLVWLMHYGYYPTGDIDHINGDRMDNRVSNLRIVTPAQNAANRLRAGRLSPGVDASSDGKYVARITHPGTKKRLYLGRYRTEAEAAAAFIGASVVLQGQYSLAVSRGLAELRLTPGQSAA